MATNQPQLEQTRRVQFTLDGFTEREGLAGMYASSAGVRNLLRGESLEFIKCKADGSDAVEVAYTCIGLCNDPTTPLYQACAYYLSAITTLLPNLEMHAKSTLRGMGHRVMEYSAENFSVIDFELQPVADTVKVTVMIGQIIFLLYKNINEASYDNFIRNRTNAMKAMIGMVGTLLPADASGSETVLSLGRAKELRQALGAQHEFRKQLLLALLANQGGGTPVGSLFAYICNMLCWNEMSAILFIYQTLCQTRSPILRNLAVRDDVKNLYTAFQEIMQTSMPQYYRILEPYNKSKVLERSRFPILAAVAQNLRSDRQQSIRNFVNPNIYNADLINRLANEHRAYMNRTLGSASDRIVSFMYSAGDLPQEVREAADTEN